MQLFSSIIKFLVFTSFAVWLTACGGGGGGGGGGSDVVLTGQFVDSPVEGVSYFSGGLSGITAAGRFSYRSGEDLYLSIGDIDLGNGLARNIFTPLTLVGATSPGAPKVINIARFLQTLDDDGDPSNGILITEAVRTAAVGMTIDFDLGTTIFPNDGNVQTVVADLTALTTAGARSLVSAAAAEAHLRSTLNDILSSGSGTYTGSSVNTVFNCTDSRYNRTNYSTGTITITSVDLEFFGATFTGNGSFSQTVQGIIFREDFSISGNSNTINFTGALNGTIDATAFADGVFQGSESSSYTGMLDGNSLTIRTPARFNQNFGFTICDLSGSTLTLSK